MNPRTRASALLVVLVMLGFISVLAAVIGRVVSGTAVDLASAMTADRAAIGAEAGLALAGALVAAAGDAEEGSEAVAEAGGQTVRLEGVTVAVAITNERGRIDLNGSPPELLAGLFKVLGVPAETAESLAARVVDFRDGDDDTEPGGAEEAAYRQAGRPAPRNGPFVHPFELVAVLGVDARLAARAFPYLTVGNPTGLVDPFVADAMVLNALPGTTPARIEEFMEDRLLGTTGRDAALLQLGVGEEFVTDEMAPGFRAEIVVTPDGGRPHRSEALVVAGDDRRPYRVLYMLDETALAALPAGG